MMIRDFASGAQSHEKCKCSAKSVHIDLCTEITRQEGKNERKKRKKKKEEKRVPLGVVSSAEGRRSISEQKGGREKTVEASW